MPKIEKHTPGYFCWTDLATNDAACAKEFYAKLFGWAVEDIPYGEGEFYSMMKKEERNVTALAPLPADLHAQGVPSHWMVYVCVDDADATASKVEAAGGITIIAPMDVFDQGRFGMFRDPQGGVFGIWQPGTHIGAGVMGETGSMCWCELLTTDRPAAREFYHAVFGWGTKGDDGHYTEFLMGETSMAGMMTIDPAWGQVPPHWSVYFQVDDCEDSVALAVLLGGIVHMPPRDIDKVGRFALLADPTGAVFAMMEMF
jgi:uncharacterized protein